MMSEMGPVGGTGGSAFDDVPPSGQMEIGGIFIHSGLYIDQLQILYRNSSSGLSALGPIHGGNGGSLNAFILNPGEFITQVSGRSGKFVDSITFLTNQGRTFGRLGGGGGSSGYRFPDQLQPNLEVFGFFGRSGQYIDSIGFHMRQRLLLPSVFVKPQWTEQGPGPTKINDTGYTKAVGAIQAVACDPIDSERVFVGAVGGGIWMSTNAASASSPAWTPQTDFSASLCVSALAFSPLDPSRNTLYAGYGITTHASGIAAGPLIGILKTTDGGATWPNTTPSQLQGTAITRILPTSLSTPTGEVVLAGTNSGLFRSTDGGVNWAPVPRFAGIAISDVKSEFGHPQRIYVATASTVVRSDDGGDQKWTDVAPPQVGATPTNGIQLSVCPTPDAAGNNWVYAGSDSGSFNAIVFSSDLGATWQTVGGTTPGGSKVGGLLVASPTLPTTLFCAAWDVSHWMVDAKTLTWTRVDGPGGGGTGVHTDGREMMFSASEDLLYEVNDGGIYRLVNPHGRPKGAARRWQEAVGDLRITEFYSIAYDSVNHVLFGAAQDNAVPHQTTPHDIDWQLSEDTGVTSDGIRVGVDNINTPGASIHYSSFYPGYLNIFRNLFTSTTSTLTNTAAQMLVNGANGLTFEQVERNRGPSGNPATSMWAVNKADGRRILVATDCLYESFDRADHLDALGGLTTSTNPVPKVSIGSVSAIAYGHTSNPDVIYVGTAQSLRVRQSGNGIPEPINAYRQAGGDTPNAIVMGPTDWRQVYVLDSQGHVWRSNDAGASNWADITGNLPSLRPAAFNPLWTIEVYRQQVPGSSEVIFVGGFGGVYATINPGSGRFAFWQKFGSNFPNALVTDVVYDTSDDILVAGTLGRSAWTVSPVSDSILQAPTLKIWYPHYPCSSGLVEQDTVTFSATINGIQDLTPPLSFEWKVLGAQATVLTNYRVSVVMPNAGQEVVLTLTVTDATGYKLFAHFSEYTISAREGELRVILCELINRLRQSRWPIDPVGPVIEPLDPESAVRMFTEIRQIATEIVTVAGHLLRE